MKVKHSIHRRFIIGYPVIGILDFLIVMGIGSYLLQNHLVHYCSNNQHDTAMLIATDTSLKQNLAASNTSAIVEGLSSVTVLKDTDIWILNADGEIVASTERRIPAEEPLSIPGFRPAGWPEDTYRIGTFYDYFKKERLSVITPIMDNDLTRGYVIVHYLMSSLYRRQNNMVEILMLIGLSLYIVSFLLLILFQRRVHNPLQEITKGASEFANGNLSYHIPVDSEDEIGYLSNTLNYMAEKLNRNGEYQKQFIANISHDFRSPLTSIKGYVEAMLDGTIPPEIQEKYLRIIAYESERLEKLTRSLRTLNELDMQKRMMHIRKFDINQVIRTTADTFEVLLNKRGILLELLLSGKELYVRADVDQIQQVLYNLLDNAIKFSPDHSTITIETEEHSGIVFVSVKDRGIGIDREELPKIWQRFYKADVSRGKDQKGTGLGLAIVKEIISAHGQNINVISTVDVGTKFIFTLEKSKKEAP